MANLRDHELAAYGIDTKPVSRSRRSHELTSFTKGILILCATLGARLAGCNNLLKDSWGKEVHETSVAQYEKRAREWNVPLMPKVIPAGATNVRPLYCCWDGIHHYLGLQLGVTLPPAGVNALLIESRRTGRPLTAPAGSSVDTYAYLMDPKLETADWLSAEKFDLRSSSENSDREFQGIAINIATNRVIWFAKSDGG